MAAAKVSGASKDARPDAARCGGGESKGGEDESGREDGMEGGSSEGGGSEGGEPTFVGRQAAERNGSGRVAAARGGRRGRPRRRAFRADSNGSTESSKSKNNIGVVTGNRYSHMNRRPEY